MLHQLLSFLGLEVFVGNNVIADTALARALGLGTTMDDLLLMLHVLIVLVPSAIVNVFQPSSGLGNDGEKDISKQMIIDD